ncbi:ABC transporter substrate-binding protein [Infirmifilum sp. NZ]|uniref:ABC transporter substrate-binding protein n=1 Tax=Infirmifilum sp. NZ TaxID=2926850 RepID=UPI002799B2DC|nr:extracellular solute-binding protein [Infirmifilum sp. NZ]UNQ73208.1 extracellular solute-binding protein [Infirmifilum sp. NZ]
MGVDWIIGARPPQQPVTTPQNQPQAEKLYYVPILDKWMTQEEIINEIKKEHTVIIADWTYGGLVETYHVPAFKKYVKDKYGVDIEVTWVGTQEPEVIVSSVLQALQAGRSAPYDVVAIEASYFFRAKSASAVAPAVYVGNFLMGNLKNINPFFLQYQPYGVVFQAIDTAGILANKEKAGWIKDYTDLADPRLKGHVILPTPGTVHFANYLVNLALAMGKNYKNPTEMQEVIKFAAEKIHPNVLRYTVSEAEIMEYLERGEAWAVAWWWYLAPVEAAKGYPITRIAQPQGNVFLPGIAWIPKKVEHPVLAQIFIDFLMSPQMWFALDFPQYRDSKGDFLMLHQNLLNDSNFDLLPDWIKPIYKDLYPYPLDKMYEWYVFPDYSYIEAHTEEWSNLYNQLTRS